TPVETYDDHRMAMAFAPLALLQKELYISHPDVVEKSYPDFWKELVAAGAEVQELEVEES
ncbi:MAG: 3-phosphoshikimate 1-carboxyvinyltransferase, partial [Bacteroidota bacterium]